MKSLCSLRSLFTTFVLLFAFVGCDDDDPATLPDTATAKVFSIDMPNRLVSLVATHPNDGITGTWSVVSQNEDHGSFTSLHDPLATFTGDVFEHYVLRWTLSNGDTEISSDVDFVIGEGYSINELSEAGVSVAKLITYFSLDKLVLYGFSARSLLDGGATVPNLVAAGMSTKALLDADVPPFEVLQGGAPLIEILIYDRANIDVLFKKGVTLQQLSDAGALVGELRAIGVTDDQLQAADLVGVVTDTEGNSYDWVKIGMQRWMTKDLKVTKFSDGELIPASEIGDSHLSLFGKMYTLEGATREQYSTSNPSGVQGACPASWHVPSSDEFRELIDAVYTDNAVKLKSDANAPNDLWTQGQMPGNNLSGFNATPAGFSDWNASNQLETKEVYNVSAYWATNGYTSCSSGHCRRTFLIWFNQGGAYTDRMEHDAAAVRCVKD